MHSYLQSGYRKLWMLAAMLALQIGISHAQQSILDKKITLKLTQVSVADALRALEDQAGCTFVYSSTLMDTQRIVSPDYQNTALGDLLKDLLGSYARGIQVQGTRINIRPAKGESRGHLKGKVQTSDGQPAIEVTVRIQGTPKGGQTDQNGDFSIRNIPAGQQKVIVSMLGYAPVEQAVTILEDQVTTFQPILLNEDSQALREVVVSGNVNKFARKETENVARLPLKNLENPQVYNVIGKALMQEQLVTERTDLYRNVPGAVPNFAGGGSQGMILRGFANFNGVRNGLTTSAILPMNPVILESVEVLKGPSGTLYGNNRSATFGGVFNYVTKKPYDTFGGEVSYTAGSYRFARAAVDVNAPVNEKRTALFRLNAAGQTEGTFQDQGYAKNFTVAPSFSYQVNDRLKFLVDVDITQAAYTTSTLTIGSLSKVTARNFKDLPLGYKQSLLNNGIDASVGVYNLQAQIEYKLSSQWKSQTNYLFSNGFYKHLYLVTFSMLSDSTVSRTARNQTPETFGNIQLQQNFIGDFQLGRMRNRVVLGADYNQNYYDLYRVTVRYDTVNIRKPMPDFNADKLNQKSSQQGFVGTSYKGTSFGVYASDVINITPSLMAMLSLRFDRFTTDGALALATGKYAGNYTQNSLSPKLGLVYQPIPERLSVFVNYLNGFVNQAPVTQPDNTVLNLKPQFGNQWEGGIKFDLVRNKLNGSLSYYNIAVTNSTRTEVINSQNFTVQDGTQKSKGIELELIANPVSGLNVVAGYAYNDNRYDKAVEALQGKLLTNSPQHVANIWASYYILKGSAKGIGIGAGGNYVGASWFESTNTFKVPAYALVNASLFYDQPRYRLALKGNNLLNEHYWNSNGSPQKPANFLASITFKW
ncbi:TonB-dependent siderophore receptor [Dyadobacter soli]|uniref:TonB-dependent siderophore receptor n=1 Tax=Dyadobacter soli TaxID=659014 RepID=A0A1G7G1T6_9BACT|nr:TonB-dependent receptor [Dyadobacter soli]SDE82015.1 TonB-dependent siderophore receptor [Dyadobacter soli]